MFSTLPTRTRRRALALAAAGAVLAGTAACGTSGPSNSAGSGSGGSGSGGSGGRITVWTLQDTALNPVQKAGADAFNKTQTAASATIQTFVNDPYKQKLQTAIGSPQAPDVFLNWGGGNLGTYVSAGQVSDLSAALSADPAWKNAFLPSVLAAGEINGKYYGVPMEGVQPVSLFYNKQAFAKAGITSAPATWADLLADITALKGRGITPIALAGSQSWTELMWMEYLLDRVGGPDKFKAIAAGTPGAWSDPAVAQALGYIVDLVDAGAFGTNYGSVGQDSGGADALLSSGKAAMELMGSWEYGGQLATSPDFVKSGGLAWTDFPTVPNGQGDPKDVVGNPSNFFSITAKSGRQAGATAFLKTVSSPDYIAGLIKIGQVPAIAGLQAQLAAGANADFTTFVYGQVQNAPSFTQSWDQALSPAAAQTVLLNLQKVFNRQETPQQFVSAVSSGS